MASAPADNDRGWRRLEYLNWGLNPPDQKRKNLKYLLDYKVRRLFDQERQSK